MPNTLDATGLTTATSDEIATDLAAALMAVYGKNINLESNSPDGQYLGIFAQADADLLDLISDIYNGFDVDAAYGISLQRLVALNGLAIKAGSFTTTPEDVTTNQALTLYGLDQSAQPAYQLQDTAGNFWNLLSTTVIGGAGTQTLVFQAATLGPITPLANTITAQATPVTGVTAVNNPTVVGAVIGVEEETDVALRIRHAKSFQLAAVGPADAVEAALQSLADVTDALVVSNPTGGAVGGQTANSIWPIVVGGTPAEIAGAIYAKAQPGCVLFGGQSYQVARPNGQLIEIKYDVGVAQALYAEFTVLPAVSGLNFNKTLLAQQLAAALLKYFKLNQAASIGDISRAMFAVEPRAIVTGAGVSLSGSGPFSDTVSPNSPINYFVIPAANIDIS
jgi:Baseplate J-like protein